MAKITVEVPDEVAKELGIIADKVGVGKVEQLVKNYIREVIIAARGDAAASQARQMVADRSSDLDILLSKETRPKR